MPMWGEGVEVDGTIPPPPFRDPTKYQYGGLRFENTSILTNSLCAEATPVPTGGARNDTNASCMPAVTLIPYSAELGMADVTGTLDVYSRHGKASPACTVNQGHGFAEAKKDNLTLTLRCHEDTAWPYHELLN